VALQRQLTNAAKICNDQQIAIKDLQDRVDYLTTKKLISSNLQATKIANMKKTIVRVKRPYVFKIKKIYRAAKNRLQSMKSSLT